MTTMLDRVVRWNLDLDGDIYGDERERLRWYEGLAVASSVHLLAMPWAAAVLVWVLGRPSVLPLAVMLVVFHLPYYLCMAYLRRRRVEPSTVGPWTAKRLVLAVLSGLPNLLFVFGAVFAFRGPGRHGLTGAVIGGLIGGLVALAVVALETRRRKRRAPGTADEEV